MLNFIHFFLIAFCLFRSDYMWAVGCEEPLAVLKNITATTKPTTLESMAALNCLMVEEVMPDDKGKPIAKGSVDICKKLSGGIKQRNKWIHDLRKWVNRTAKREKIFAGDESCPSLAALNLNIESFIPFLDLNNEFYQDWHRDACAHQLIIHQEMMPPKKDVVVTPELISSIGETCSVEVRDAYRVRHTKLANTFPQLTSANVKSLRDAATNCKGKIKVRRETLADRLDDFQKAMAIFNEHLHNGYTENVCQRFKTGGEETYKEILSVLNPGASLTWEVESSPPIDKNESTKP